MISSYVYKGVICVQVCHIIMGNLQYRSIVWICGLLCQDSDISKKGCPTIPLFKAIMNQRASWGRYAVYMTWLDQQFPCKDISCFAI